MENNSHDIFVSYSKKDYDQVSKYVDLLRSHGYAVWIDIASLPSGPAFSKRIVEAIENSKVFLFFSSENSNKSQWTQGEVIAALNYGKPIIPVKLDSSPFAKEIMLMMLPLNHIDTTLLADREVEKKLQDAVRAYVAEPLEKPEEIVHSEKNNNVILKKYLYPSIAWSIIVAILWTWVSGEYHLNFSLAALATVLGAFVGAASAYLGLSKTFLWEERPVITNLILLFSTIVFSVYSFIAISLGFINLSILALNLPSALFSIVAVYGLWSITNHKKKGYWILWLSAFLLGIGSFWWVSRIEAMAIIAAAIVLMMSFTLILMVKAKGISTWEKLGFKPYNQEGKERIGCTFKIVICVVLLALIIPATTIFRVSMAPERAREKSVEEVEPYKITVEIGNVTFNMIAVPEGKFMMGANVEQKEAASWEKPSHEVFISQYLIGETEVTQELWEEIMNSNPSFFRGLENPVDSVDWNDCQNFIAKLNEKTEGKYGFCLPTEAEWEYAAQGAGDYKRYRFSGGNRLDDVAWYKTNSNNESHKVGQKHPNELGIYDMSGNVWEWCQDWGGKYMEDPLSDPIGNPSDTLRALRGGAYCNDSDMSRVSYRFCKPVTFKRKTTGFRLAAKPTSIISPDTK